MNTRGDIRNALLDAPIERNPKRTVERTTIIAAIVRILLITATTRILSKFQERNEGLLGTVDIRMRRIWRMETMGMRVMTIIEIGFDE